MDIKFILMCLAAVLFLSSIMFFQRIVGEMLTTRTKTRFFAWSATLSIVVAISLIVVVEQIHKREHRQRGYNPIHDVESPYYETSYPKLSDNDRYWRELWEAQRQGG